MMENYRLLLEQAALLYERHEARRTKPFNLFPVLRSESDEVNLHSPFLHALLDWEKPGKGRENLVDFLQLQHVGAGNFEQNNVNVKREHDYIDILITNDVRESVAIENKIYAGDQPKQLCRYYNTLKNQGYVNIHLLYLTLHGADPSEASFCGPHCDARSHHKTISYEDTLPDWLERCQQRAYDEPGLRESVAQYRLLVQKLTGTDFGRAYMDALTELCLQGNNLLLVHDLAKAAEIEAKIALLKKLWCEIDAALKMEIAKPPSIDKDFNQHASEERIRLFFRGAGDDRYHGLYYSLGNGPAKLAVEAGNGNVLVFGIRCVKAENPQTYNELRGKLQKVQGTRRPTGHWPWYRSARGLNLRNASREDIGKLSNETDRKAHAKSIAEGLKPVWEAVKKGRPRRSEPIT